MTGTGDFPKWGHNNHTSPTKTIKTPPRNPPKLCSKPNAFSTILLNIEVRPKLGCAMMKTPHGWFTGGIITLEHGGVFFIGFFCGDEKTEKNRGIFNRQNSEVHQAKRGCLTVQQKAGFNMIWPTRHGGIVGIEWHIWSLFHVFFLVVWWLYR